MRQALKVGSAEDILKKIRPGMSIFLGTGVSEPRTLLKHLMTVRLKNLEDLELIQLASFGEASSLRAIASRKFRLKTFFAGHVSKAIRAGNADLIPARFAMLPAWFESGRIHVDVAFIQITPPDEAGYCSLGLSMDVARAAMQHASIVAGEINPHIPVTLGDTFVRLSDFDFLLQSDEKPIYFPRWPIEPTFNKVAAQISKLIGDGSCISFSIGPLFETLSLHLSNKRHLGIHSPIFTDALMNLVKSGAVTNRYKAFFQGKSLCSYAFGSPELLSWLNRNPLVEFQGIDKVFSPANIGLNPRFVTVIPARKVDLSGRIVLHTGVSNVATGPVELLDFFEGAEISDGGISIFGLPSRNRKGVSNIVCSVDGYQNQFRSEESIDIVVTEFGTASLKGLSIRERAQSLIDIAHPDDRKHLVEQAKKKNILYADQIFIPECSLYYPFHIDEKHTFKDKLTVRFRPIRPSDEEQMRRLFYRFSDQAIYSRYFARITSMPHEKMQEYVNVNWNETVSFVGLIGEPGEGRIIAEGRYIKIPGRSIAELAFVVDEEYQNLGIASYLVELIKKTAKKRGISTFNFEVLFSNYAMMKVFRKTFKKINAFLENGIYDVTLFLE